MDTTTAVTGISAAILLLAAPLTAVTSLFLLWLFRRATLRAMGRSIGDETHGQPLKPQNTTAPNRPPLTVQNWQPGKLPVGSTNTNKIIAEGTRSRRSALPVYIAGGLAFAIVMSIPWVIVSDVDFRPGLFLTLVLIHAWPIVLVIGLMETTNWIESAIVACGYFIVVGVVVIPSVVRNPDLSIGESMLLWLLINGPATLLLVAFLYRRIRSVGPLVLAFMTIALSGAFLLTELVRYSDSLQRILVTLGVPFGLGGVAIFILIQIVGFVALGILGWWLLSVLGRRYKSKRFSDQSIILDSMWLVFGIAQSIPLVIDGWAWVFSGIVGFLVYKIVVLIGFAIIRKRTASKRNAPMLLLLRVFALGRRSEQFFHVLSKWWRRTGSVSMIAGPDLLTAVVEPYEFLDFVSGKLSRQFVQGEADLQQRLALLDKRADPDSLYRVNEFFCHADTWQMTMRQLARESNAVLMDLRSFSPENQGCLYELEQLLDIVDLAQVTFLVDETTDLRFLEKTLQMLWNNVNIDSPNCRVESPTVQIVHAGGQSRQLMKTLMFRLSDSLSMESVS